MRMTFGGKGFLPWGGVLLLFLLVGLPSVCRAAEDMRFVDAKGTTGYYVDVNSIAYEGDTLVNARIAVKKAVANRMFVYAMRFDRENRTYQIFASQVLRYDTREVLESQDTGGAPRHYGHSSPMNEIVEYIFSLRRGE